MNRALAESKGGGLPPSPSPSRAMRWVVYASLAFALSGVGSACNASKAESGLPPAEGEGVKEPEVPKVKDLLSQEGTTAKAAQGPLSGTGTLYPRESAELGPKSSGVIAAIQVKEGDVVKKGQLVFRLESGQQDLAVKQASTMLDAAKVGLNAAEVDFKRTKDLFDRGAVAPATFDQVQARYDNAKAAVSQAEVAKSMALRASSDSAVHSPIDGVVTAKLKSVGETATMMPPTVVLVIQNLKVLELRVHLPEAALRTLNVNSPIKASFPSLGVELTVPVKRINPSVDVISRTVEIIAEIDNSDGRLRAGMLAQVSLAQSAAPAPSAEPAPASNQAKTP
jgi:RND family efflux transporter MFP subunit